ncbi:MAG: copper-translocating P-type ATPase [Clostridia bacterium]|nr:copper-translocating P-type ATPase [Clostridia bacterium]
MKKIILAIEGMTCSACSNGLEKYLNKQDGVQKAEVNLIMANATIEYDEKKLNIAKLEEFVKKAGFRSKGEFKEIKTERENKKQKYLLIIFTFLAIILMYISMGHMIKIPIIEFLNPHINPTNYTITLLVLTIAFLIYGFDIIKNGYKNLIHKTPNMNTLVGIGVLTSFLYSVYNMYLVFNGNNNQVMNLYFESSAIVIYFIKLGRYIDGISKDKTKEAIQKLVTITPQNAVIKVNGELKQVTLDEIKKGDIVIAKAGEKIAVDGKIVNGKAHVDESFITGESKPTTKEIGSKVIAGSLNYDGYIEYKAERIGRETTVSEIVKLVVEASNTKAPIAKVADKVSGYFVPLIIIIAILTFIIYMACGQGLEVAITTFVTVLVVACPCSLGLATPLAIVVSQGVCASNGILIKKNEILENAQKANVIVFDKTGTLTYGKLKVSKINNYSKLDEDSLMQLVGSLETKSNHPIGSAFANYLQDKKLSNLQVKNYENLSGYGIVGEVDNKKIIVGNYKILELHNIKNNYKQDEIELSSDGNSIVYVVQDNQIIALIGVNDIVKNEASETIKELNNMNIETIMLTGDNKETAEKIAKKIGITKVVSNVLPKEKSNIINQLKKENKFVIMCGDGINDSPALTIADIGISVNGGTDIAMDSSQVILTKNDLTSITKLINISKKTIRNIKQNLFWAFFYNFLMIPIAMGVLKPIGISINPIIASLAMVISSITVILNTLRLKHVVAKK